MHNLIKYNSVYGNAKVQSDRYKPPAFFPEYSSALIRKEDILFNANFFSRCVRSFTLLNSSCYWNKKEYMYIEKFLMK